MLCENQDKILITTLHLIINSVSFINEFSDYVTTDGDVCNDAILVGCKLLSAYALAL